MQQKGLSVLLKAKRYLSVEVFTRKVGKITSGVNAIEIISQSSQTLFVIFLNFPFMFAEMLLKILALKIVMQYLISARIKFLA